MAYPTIVTSAPIPWPARKSMPMAANWIAMVMEWLIGWIDVPIHRPAPVWICAVVKIKDEIRLPGVNFETNSDRLLPGAEQVLRDAATTLARNPDLKVEVAGHTDDRGAADYNQGLSERRAKTVRDYLIDRGADAANLSVRGYGEASPIASTQPPKAGRKTAGSYCDCLTKRAVPGAAEPFRCPFSAATSGYTGPMASSNSLEDRLPRALAASGLRSHQIDPTGGLSAAADPLEPGSQPHGGPRPEAKVERHLLESLAIQDWIVGSRVCDAGSGAGLPGLPLAVAQPERHFVLVERAP